MPKTGGLLNNSEAQIPHKQRIYGVLVLLYVLFVPTT
jgi:hypothetical protein